MNEHLKMAIANISKKGDTDIFPYPVENVLFFDKQEKVLEILSEMSEKISLLNGNKKQVCITSSIPVGYTGYRWATFIEPEWNALFLAEVLKIAEKIESKRIPKEKNTIFSYRYNFDEESGSLFDMKYNWKSYYNTSAELAINKKHVVTFDISDFYNRISHAKLRNILIDDVGADTSIVNNIMMFLQNFANGSEAMGLPVGGNASRILAEAYLIKADNFLAENKIQFCRYVDDYILFADSAQEAHQLINYCTNFFYKLLGLSMAKHKTNIMTKAEFKKHVRMIFDEVKEDENSPKSSVMKLNLNVDHYSLTAEDDLKDLKGQVAGSGIISLLKSECKKTRINQMFSKQLVRTLKFLEEEDISEAFELLGKNFEKLYPVFPQVMRTSYYNLPKCKEESQRLFIDSIISLFETNSFVIQSENNASYALRVLSLFKNDKVVQTIDHIYKNAQNGFDSELVKMNAIYAMANLGNKSWISDRMETFPELSNWERRAMAAAKTFLGIESDNLIKDQKNSDNAMEALLVNWVQEKMGQKQNWKLPL